MAIKGLEQAVENLSRISKTAVPGAAAMAIKWMFKDGVVIKRTYTEEEQRQQAENEKQSLLQLVRDKTQLWDSQLRLGIISDENKQKLTEWMLYAQKVESTDTSSLPVTFPEQPE